MGELRKDYILDRWVVIAPKRGKRPHQFEKAAKPAPKKDFFAPGNEQLTPNERGRIEKSGKWQLRWFENKFPALSPEGDPVIKTHNRFFTFADAYGHHEIVVETRDRNKQLAEFSVDELRDVLKAYANRIVELERDGNIKYVNVFKNHGFLGGTSIVHSHSQVIATAFVPPLVKEKIHAMKRFVHCPYCDVVEIERKGERCCAETNDFVAFAPYASRFNYEVWVVPKKHVSRFEKVNLDGLAEILEKVLAKVKEANWDYNMLLYYGPVGEDFHVHVEVCPRPSIWAGFELGSGVIINTVAPEDAARFYRGEE